MDLEFYQLLKKRKAKLVVDYSNNTTDLIIPLYDSLNNDISKKINEFINSDLESVDISGEIMIDNYFNGFDVSNYDWWSFSNENTFYMQFDISYQTSENHFDMYYNVFKEILKNNFYIIKK